MPGGAFFRSGADGSGDPPVSVHAEVDILLVRAIRAQGLRRGGHASGASFQAAIDRPGGEAAAKNWRNMQELAIRWRR